MVYILGTYFDISLDVELPLELTRYTHVFLQKATFDNKGQLIFPLAFYHPISDKHISGTCAKIFQMKRDNRGIKVILNIAASDDLFVFNKIICDVVYMDTLVESICDAVRNYGLDGVDIKWQHPISGIQPETFAAFIKTLKFRFTQIQMFHGYPTLFICVTINPRITSLEYYNLDLYDHYIDIFHLKGYDSDENWMKYVSHYNVSYHDLRESVKYLNKIGTKSEKILIGIPFHGHMFHGTMGFNERYISSKIVKYRDICLEDKNIATYNDECGVSCIYNKDKRTYISLEDITSIYEKIVYMKQEALGGIVSSETDDTLSNLLASIIVPKEKESNNIVYITSAFTNIKN